LSDLRDELGITKSQWAHLTRADCIISENSQVYALVYLRTGYGDPRTLPPKVISPITTIDRAWSEKKWRKWYFDHTGQEYPDPNAPAPVTEEPPVLEPQLPQPPQLDSIRALILELTAEFEPFMLPEKSAAERDALVDSYGKEMYELFNQLKVLVSDRHKREGSVRMNAIFGGKH
jgi:hypothetical protein